MRINVSRRAEPFRFAIFKNQLNVEATLTVEDGKQVVYARCALGKSEIELRQVMYRCKIHFITGL